jgi:hypothetical protein
MRPTVSITCVDTLFYKDTIYALNRTIATLKDKINLTHVYWFSDIAFPGECDLPVVWIPINKFTNVVVDMNFVLLKLVPQYVTTDYNLNIQADGFAVNSEAWTDEFFEYDYIGAQWYRPSYPTHKVGNGGFCLKSKKLFTTLKSVIYSHIPRYRDFPGNKNLEIDYLNTGNYRIKTPDDIVGEDVLICRVLADRLTEEFGIRFAPLDIADQFSIEDNYSSPWLGKSLGFHGKGNEQFYGITFNDN